MSLKLTYLNLRRILILLKGKSIYMARQWSFWPLEANLFVMSWFDIWIKGMTLCIETLFQSHGYGDPQRLTLIYTYTIYTLIYQRYCFQLMWLIIRFNITFRVPFFCWYNTYLLIKRSYWNNATNTSNVNSHFVALWKNESGHKKKKMLKTHFETIHTPYPAHTSKWKTFSNSIKYLKTNIIFP